MTIDVLNSILLSDTPSVLIKNNEQQLFSLIPELSSCKGFDQKSPWHIYDVYEHILKVTDLVACNSILRFAALFHDVGKPEVFHMDEKGIGHFFGHWERSAAIFRAFAEEHDLDAGFTNSVCDLIYYHDIGFDKLTDEELSELLKNFDEEKIRILFAFKRADLSAQNPKYRYLLDSYDLQEKRALKQLLK